jgi:hypothetical protein
MAEPVDPRDTSIPNQPSSKEKAEESRENENVESGIGNRPIAEEQREQQNLPPRGRTTDEENH